MSEEVLCDYFLNEFAQMSKSIIESIERETELQRQLRRTKEAYTALTNRLLVANKVISQDEQTIQKLIIQYEEAKIREQVALNKVEEASQIISDLTSEINLLKSQIKSMQEKTGSGLGQSSNNMVETSLIEKQHQINEQADEEVDHLLSLPLKTFPSSNIPNNSTSVSYSSTCSPLLLQQATPFDRWKMDQFIYTTDTPGGSINHNSDVVDVLIQAANSNLLDETILKSTQTTLGKIKLKNLNKMIANKNKEKEGNGSENLFHYYSSSSYSPSLGGGANDFTNITDADDFQNHVSKQRMVHNSHPSTASGILQTQKNYKNFFVSSNSVLTQKWGSGTSKSLDLASSSSSPLILPHTEPRPSSSNKLKSLHLPSNTKKLSI